LHKQKSLPQEQLLGLFINGRFFSHILCTPVDVKELTIGWLFTQGYIAGTDDINSLGVCDGVTDISVSLRTGFPSQPPKYRPVATTGCAGGQVNPAEYFKDMEKLTSSLKVSGSCLPAVMSAMFRDLASRGSMSGMHCASLASGNNFTDLLVGHDVGRHNAVDKVIGAGLLRGIDFGSAVLATSGRVSSDMVLKAMSVGVPVIVSQRSVTTLAAAIAESVGIAIVGRLNKPDRIILGQTDRITD